MNESQRRQSKKQVCILELGTIQLINSQISYLVIALLKQIAIYVA